MAINEIISMIVENGFVAVIIGFFLFKDLRYSAQINTVLSEMSTALSEMKSVLGLMKDLLTNK